LRLEFAGGSGMLQSDWCMGMKLIEFPKRELWFAVKFYCSIFLTGFNYLSSSNDNRVTAFSITSYFFSMKGCYSLKWPSLFSPILSAAFFVLIIVCLLVEKAIKVDNFSRLVYRQLFHKCSWKFLLCSWVFLGDSWVIGVNYFSYFECWHSG